MKWAVAIKKYHPILYTITGFSTIFIIDLLTPLGVAVGVLYAFCFYFLRKESSGVLFLFASIAAVLTILKLVINIAPEIHRWVWINRGISISSVFAIAVIMSKKTGYSLRTNSATLLYASVSFVSVFIVDIFFSPGIATGLLYGACLLFLAKESPRKVFFFSLTATFLILLKWAVFNSTEALEEAYSGKLVEIGIIFLISVVLSKNFEMYNSNKLLNQLKDNLKQSVDEKSVMIKQISNTLNLFYKLTEQSDESIYVTNAGFEIEYINPAACKLYGFTREEMLYQTPNIFKSGKHSREFYSSMKNEIKSGNVFKAEFTNKTKKGEIVIEEKIITPLMNENGNITHYISSGRDITQKKLREKMIEEQQKFISTVNNALPSINYIYDYEDIRLKYINGKVREILGYEPKEILAFSREQLRELIHQGSLKEMFDAGSKEWSKILKVRCKSGNYKWLLINQVAFNYNKEGIMTQVIGIASDITSEKKLETKINAMERLRLILRKKQQKLRTTLLLQGQEDERKRLAMEVHDGIGQMLTCIKISIENCKSQIGETPSEDFNTKIMDVQFLVSQTLNEVRRVANNLSSSLLFDFGLFSAVKKLIATQIPPSTGIKVSFNTNLEHTRFHTNTEVNLYRIIQESLNNAVKYSNATAITLTLRTEEDQLCLVIHDNGKGFDSKKYFSNNNFDAAVKGIGFTNISERVKLLGGRLKINSDVGKGCEIKVLIPGK